MGENENTGAAQENTAAETKSTETAQFDFNNPEFQKFIQSSIDRATNKLGNENKTLRTQLEELQQSKLTDEELKNAEIQKRENDIAEREAALKFEKNKMYALTAIKAAGLDDGTADVLGLVDLCMADDEKAIDEKVKSLDGYVKKIVASEIDKVFKANGRTPGSSTDSGKTKSSAAVDIGKKAAAVNKSARNILDYYTGGKS